MVEAEIPHIAVDGCSVCLLPNGATIADGPKDGMDTVMGRGVTSWRCPDCGTKNEEVGSVYDRPVACRDCGLAFLLVS